MFIFVVLLNLIVHCLSSGQRIPTMSTIPGTTLGGRKYHIEKVAETGSGGEEPHWDLGQQALFFLDPQGKMLHKYVPATNKHTKTGLDATIGIGFMVPVEGTTDQFIVGVDLKLLIVQWDGEEGSEVKILETLAEVHNGSRFNDGKADPMGRLFAGTLGAVPFASALFRLDGSKISTVEVGLTVGNGLVWDKSEYAFYYIDSTELLKIRRYDCDTETGNISNRTYVFDGKKYGILGVLDGMTIDTDGNLLVANYGGGSVLHIDPRTGQLLDRIPIIMTVPAMLVTSVALGGPNLDTMYVTTAKPPTKENIAQSLDVDNSGATFAVTGLGIQGCPMSNFKYV